MCSCIQRHQWPGHRCGMYRQYGRPLAAQCCLACQASFSMERVYSSLSECLGLFSPHNRLRWEALAPLNAMTFKHLAKRLPPAVVTCLLNMLMPSWCSHRVLAPGIIVVPLVRRVLESGLAPTSESSDDESLDASLLDPLLDVVNPWEPPFGLWTRY